MRLGRTAQTQMYSGDAVARWVVLVLLGDPNQMSKLWSVGPVGGRVKTLAGHDRLLREVRRQVVYK